jgi:hypothetical protein
MVSSLTCAATPSNNQAADEAFVAAAARHARVTIRDQNKWSSRDCIVFSSPIS